MVAPDRKGLRVGKGLLEVRRQLVHAHSKALPSLGTVDTLGSTATISTPPPGTALRRARPRHAGRASLRLVFAHPCAQTVSDGPSVELSPAASSQISAAMRPHGASRRCEKKRSASVY